VPRTQQGTPREEGLGTGNKAYIAPKEQPIQESATTWVQRDHTIITTRSDSRSIKGATQTKWIQATYGEPPMDSRAMDRPQPLSGHQGKRPDNQRHSYDRRSGYRGPIHGYVSREAAGRYRSRPEDLDSHPNRQARLNRMDIYVWGVKCRDSRDNSCSKVRSGASQASSTAGGISDSQQALQVIQAGNDARTGRALLSKIAESRDGPQVQMVPGT
jgi:hypothetical protein